MAGSFPLHHVHRIGRTGRNNSKGYARSFLTRNMSPLTPDLVLLLQANRINTEDSFSIDQTVPKLLQELADEQKRLNEFGAWEVGL